MTPKRIETLNSGYWSSSANTKQILTPEDKIKEVAQKKVGNYVCFISVWNIQKAQGLEVFGEGKAAVILFYIY